MGVGVDWVLVILAQVLSLVISLDNNSTNSILGNMPFFTCITMFIPTHCPFNTEALVKPLNRGPWFSSTFEFCNIYIMNIGVE
jgi:hypothetical protein